MQPLGGHSPKPKIQSNISPKKRVDQPSPPKKVTTHSPAKSVGLGWTQEARHLADSLTPKPTPTKPPWKSPGKSPGSSYTGASMSPLTKEKHSPTKSSGSPSKSPWKPASPAKHKDELPQSLD